MVDGAVVERVMEELLTRVRQKLRNRRLEVEVDLAESAEEWE
jgi:hypothetical protein